MKYQTFFWDFDGTLFDTYPGMVASFMAALQQQRVSELELDEVAIYEVMRRHSLGTAIRQFSAEFGINADRLERDYRAIEATHVTDAQPFDGVIDLLTQLKANGGQHFLLTHRDKSAIERLENVGIKKLFTDIITSEQPFPRKPDPASLNALVQRHHVSLKTAIMIGDRNLDVEAGHRAGMAGGLFDPGRLIDSQLSRPEIDVTNVSGLAAALLAD